MRIVVTIAEKMAQLSPREGEVVKLLAQGCTNKEIGAALGIQPSTVGCHIAHMMDALGFRSRLLLGLWAITNPRCVDGVAVPTLQPLPFAPPVAPVPRLARIGL